VSEYTHRYQHVGHQQLYDGVMAGKPDQIENLAAQWAALKGILDGLSRELSGDLDKVANTWTGSASQEFQRRMTLVTDYADTLGEGMADVSRGLNLMADELRVARKQAESPAETDDSDKTISGAAKGAVFGLPGAVVGGLLGHQQDKAEQEKAQKRMVKVVSELAANYDLSAYGRLVKPPPPHPDTPDLNRPSTSNPRVGPRVSTPTSVPTTRPSGKPRSATVEPSGTPGSGPNNGSHGAIIAGVGGGQSGGATGGGMIGGGVVGEGGTPSTSLAGATALTNSTTVPGIGGTPAASAGTGSNFQLGPQGGNPSVLGTGALAGSGGKASASAVRSPGASPVADNRAATGIGRRLDGARPGPNGAGGAGGAGGQAVSGTGRTGGVANRPGLLGAGQKAHDDDDSDGRLTWLTEDDMVWGDDKTAAPPVLGTDG